MQVEASVVKIYGAYYRRCTVGYAGLGVDKSGSVLIYLHSHSRETAVVVPRYHVNIPLVRDMWRYYAHVHSLFCRKAQCIGHFLVQYQIGRGNTHAAPCVVDKLKVHAFANRLFVKRRIRKWLHKAVTDGRYRISLYYGSKSAYLFALGLLPELHEHDRVIPHGFTPYHYSGILPVSEALLTVDILIGKIGTAVECGMTVDYDYLAVVAVVLYR